MPIRFPDVSPLPEQLSALWLLPPSDEKDPGKVERALRERIKELNCLYAVAKLAEQHPDSMADLLTNVVTVLPPSWQYPSLTEARIEFRGDTYLSPDFRITHWRQTAPIRMYGETVGEVCVVYTKACPEAYEGPFLREERALLDAVSERIGTVATRMLAEQKLQETNRQLEVERKALHESNLALRAVLARIEEEKRDGQRSIQANVEKILMPIIHALLVSVPKSHRKYVELLRDNLEDITSPFVKGLSQKYDVLTPTEIRICNMIRNGMRTKEIARIRGVSQATVSRHREHIRHKLGIANCAVNLMTCLQSEVTSGPK